MCREARPGFRFTQSGLRCSPSAIATAGAEKSERAPTSPTGVFVVRSTMSNSDAPSLHHRKRGDDDAEPHSRDALRIRGFLHAFKKACLERTGGGVFAPPNREAERRTAHHGCRASMDRRGRGPISGPLAFRRSSAVMRRDFSRLGLGRASWNHRMQTGGPSPAPVQRAPRSPARAGRDDAQAACRLRATNSAHRNRTRSVSRRHRLTSLTMSGMDAVNQIRSAPSKAFRFMQTNRGVALSDGCRAQARTRFTPFSKIRKSEVVPVNQGFLCCCESLRGCAVRPNCTAARRMGSEAKPIMQRFGLLMGFAMA